MSNINAPKLVYTYAEAVNYFGYSDDWEKYTLCEFVYSQFALYGMSPCVLINVLDPSKHKENITEKEYTITNAEINLGTEILLSGFEAASIVSSGEDDETEDEDFESEE